MQNFAFVDETLDINLSQSYHLSIQADLNGLSFCLLDPVRNKYIVLEHYNFKPHQLFDDYLNELENFLDNHTILNQSFKKVKLIWLSRKNALIPDQLFNKNKLKPLIELTHSLDDLDEIHYKPLKYNNIVSTFVIPNLIAILFIKKYPEIEFYNQHIPLINHIIQKHHSEQTKGFVNIQNNFFDFVITNNGQIQFYNNFKLTTSAEMAYYILYALEQNKLGKQNTEIILSGMIQKTSAQYQTLTKFIKSVKFDHRPEDFTYSYTFNKVPYHSF
ncbi:MAG TPA: DUF3822 family protein, partial [Bacteroidales bacterium]|nr:DUF3822 family protein [Bacteroidales bacterium]